MIEITSGRLKCVFNDNISVNIHIVSNIVAYLNILSSG